MKLAKVQAASRDLFSCIVVIATLAPAQNFKVLADFENSNGAIPYFGPLVQGADGNLYGLTTAGGVYNGNGTVFRIRPDGSLTSLHSFNGLDGSSPSWLILGDDGNFYGTAYGGGAYADGGVFFKMTRLGTVTVLYNFCAQPDCADGESPDGPIVQAADGNFYGTTIYGGQKDRGTIYRMTRSGALTTLYSFCDRGGCPDGAWPIGLTRASDENFYGVASGGGALGGGVIFRITPDGAYRRLQSFLGVVEPSQLIQAADGSLYGTTTYGGLYQQCANGCGTIFRFSQDNVMTTLYEFCSQSNCGDGTYPSGALFQATDGGLYGATSSGGIYDWGTVFRFGATGKLSVLHTFEQTDGNLPTGIFQDTNGFFYGTTVEGGDLTCRLVYSIGCGTVFGLSRGLGPFVAFVRPYGKVGQTGGILGQGFTGTTSVELNGVPADFNIVSDTYLTATVPDGASSGYVVVNTPSGALKSNVPFRVIQ